MLLILPKSFQNGGYGVSSIALICSSIVTTFCVLKLIEAAEKTGIMNYSKLGRLAFGRGGKVAIEVMVALT